MSGTTAACPRWPTARPSRSAATWHSPRVRWLSGTVAELIQYTPTTDTVHERPVLVVPPPIGRFYFLDLRPGRSCVEYSVSRGLQTFLLSWRNPSKEQADCDLDTYAARVLRAIDAVREISGSDDVNTIGFCAGGIINTSPRPRHAQGASRRDAGRAVAGPAA